MALTERDNDKAELGFRGDRVAYLEAQNKRYRAALTFVANGRDATVQSFAKRAVQIARAALTAPDTADEAAQAGDPEGRNTGGKSYLSNSQ